MSVQGTAVLFDYGNVLTLSPDSGSLQRICELAGADPARLAASYGRHRNAYDGGELTGAGYWARVLEEQGIPIGDVDADALIREDIRRWSCMNESMLDWVRELSAGGRHLGLLSNIHHDHVRFLREEAEWIRYFPVRIYSCEHRVTKPDPAIYRLAVASLGVPAESCIFFDDLPENVEAARREGIRAVLFEGISGAKEALRRFEEENVRV